MPRAGGCRGVRLKPANLFGVRPRHSVGLVFRPGSQPDDLKADLLKPQSAHFIDERHESFEHGHLVRPDDDSRVARFAAERSRQPAIGYGFVVQEEMPFRGERDDEWNILAVADRLGFGKIHGDLPRTDESGGGQHDHQQHAGGPCSATGPVWTLRPTQVQGVDGEHSAPVWCTMVVTTESSDIDDAHHPLVLVVEDVAVVHGPAAEVGVRDPEPHR